jgi:hypothetical protein
MTCADCAIWGVDRVKIRREEKLGRQMVKIKQRMSW